MQTYNRFHENRQLGQTVSSLALSTFICIWAHDVVRVTEMSIMLFYEKPEDRQIFGDLKSCSFIIETR